MSWEKLSKHFHGSHGARDAIGSRHDDVLVYRASEHAGMHDRYVGGAGRDTLQLEFTREQWLGGAVAGNVLANDSVPDLVKSVQLLAGPGEDSATVVLNFTVVDGSPLL